MQSTLEDPEEWQDVESGMSELSVVGRAMLARLFGKELPRFLDIFDDLFPDAGYHSEVPPSIQLISEVDTVVPLEFFPVFRYGDNSVKISDERTLFEVASRFPGIAANVRRHISDGPVAQLPLRQVGRICVPVLTDADELAVTLFRNVALEKIDKEIDKFHSYGSRLAVRGPWPGGRVVDRDGILAEILCGISGGMGKGWPDMLHFACHCQTGPDIPTDVTIRLSGENQDVDVRLVHLEERSGQLLVSQPLAVGRSNNLPLVFLNACSSAVAEPMTGASLPAFFLRNGYIGFVGTEAAVPDRVAAAFSGMFYREFLSGQSLGQSILQAKRAILAGYRNPLGILYTTYADGDIYVEKPEEEDSSG
ncbi:CHAT domain-containing protein [Streptomyces rishiriensis]|uniref:CHAT domain-containing protein n=1 Tax=Streptomyces rishiriensis TaxID=68264 RepID=UPI0034081FC4